MVTMLSFRHPPFFAVLCAVLMAHGLLIGWLLLETTAFPKPLVPLAQVPPSQKVQSVRLLAIPQKAHPDSSIKAANAPTPAPAPAPVPAPPPAKATSLSPKPDTRPGDLALPKALLPSPLTSVLAKDNTSSTPLPATTNGLSAASGTTASAKATAATEGGKAATRSDSGGESHAKAAEGSARGGTASVDSGVTLPDAHPYYKTNPQTDYPKRSRDLGEEGKVVLRVWVSADGLPTKAEVASSSGYERLNASALQMVMRWRFVPGKRKGQSEAMEVLVPMQFRLEGT